MSASPRGAPIELVIEAQSASGKPRRLVLRPGQTRQVGRGARVDLSIPEDGSLSDAHFSVTCDESGGRVRDLRSRNGLFVNGERASELRITDGDRITAGRTEFAVRVSAPSSSASHAASAPPRNVAGIERPYSEGVSDPDPEVRRAALLAAAATRRPWLLEHCRKAARTPSIESREELLVLAILAESSDSVLLLDLARNESLGPLRFEILGALGRPDSVPTLIAAIASDDPATASAAARAFTKITGADIDTGERAPAPAEGDAAEFAPDVAKPSFEKAALHWRRVEGELGKSDRVRCGHAVSSNPESRLLERLDLESRSEMITQVAYWEGLQVNRINE